MADAPKGTRRGPYAKSADQRNAIVRAAIEDFGRRGYHGASMREIARRAGLSQAGLLHHFPTKMDLLTAVIESRDALSLRAALDAKGPTQDPLAAMVAIVADNATHPELVQMFVVVSAEATDADHPAHEHFRQRGELVVRLMHDSLEQAVERGQVRRDLDLDHAARQCQALMYGLQVQWLLDPTIDMALLFGQFLEGFAPR